MERNEKLEGLFAKAEEAYAKFYKKEGDNFVGDQKKADEAYGQVFKEAKIESREVRFYYNLSKENGYEFLTIEDFWAAQRGGEEGKQAVETLENLGIKKFVLTDKSTALMANLHFFVDHGFSIKPYKFTEKNRWDDSIQTRIGILLEKI